MELTPHDIVIITYGLELLLKKKQKELKEGSLDPISVAEDLYYIESLIAKIEGICEWQPMISK